MKILSSCCKPLSVSFFCWTQRKIFWRTFETHNGLQQLKGDDLIY